MHAVSALTVSRVNRALTERIGPATYSDSIPLTVQAYELDGEPISPDDALDLPFVAHRVGSAWGPAWGTTWFHVTGTIPSQWSGRPIEARFDLGFDVSRTGFQCEGLVYRADGAPIKSINPRNQYVRIAESAHEGDEVDLYIEAASNPDIMGGHRRFIPTFEGDSKTASPAPIYRTRTMDLAVFEPDVFELAIDLRVLVELQGELEETSPRRMRILQALDESLNALDLQRIVTTAPAARERLAAVLTEPASKSSHRIAAIGHAHIDSAWLWPTRETVRKVARTATTMTTLLDEDDDFRYAMSSAQQFEWLQIHRPRTYRRVKDAVESGRFHPVGGMWVESDTVMPTGEALARQFLYGQRYFVQQFGRRCRGVWLPDSFGYSPALPQLMRRAGFEWFFTQKLSWNQVNTFPHHSFMWEGLDGSRVFTHFPSMDTYSAELTGAEVALASRQFSESRVSSRSIAPVGWGDGGGGTTREMTARAQRLRDLEGSARVEWTNPDTFFDEAISEMPNPPVWVGELYLELHRGTLTSQHATKAHNRAAEQALVEAELWSASAAIRHQHDYPYDDLDDLWKTLLLQQFHDILPGTSIAWVHREAVSALENVEQRARQISDRARRVLAGTPRTSSVDDADAKDSFKPGRELVFSPSSLGAHTPLGAKWAGATAEPVSMTETESGITLENEHVMVQISMAGLITAAIDKSTRRNAIAPEHPAALLRMYQDFPNMWDAWDIDEHYRYRAEDIDMVDSLTAALVNGRAEVTVTRTFSNSRVTQVFSLAPHDRMLTITNDVEWQEVEKLLKIAFPLDVMAACTEAETQFGFVARPTHTNTSWEAAKFEASMHRFVLVREPDFGVALVNDSIYGYSTTRAVGAAGGVITTVEPSLLRAPRFPDPETDTGRHSITLGLVVGADPMMATEHALRLNAPVTYVHGVREVAPLVSVVGDENLVISSVKLAADRSGDVIVRVYEAAGKRARGEIVPDFPYSSIREVSLIEDDASYPAHEGATLTLTPFEVRTVRICR